MYTQKGMPHRHWDAQLEEHCMAAPVQCTLMRKVRSSGQDRLRGQDDSNTGAFQKAHWQAVSGASVGVANRQHASSRRASQRQTRQTVKGREQQAEHARIDDQSTYRQGEKLQLVSLRGQDDSSMGASSQKHMGAGTISPELHGPEGGGHLLPLPLPMLVAPSHTMCILQ